MSGQASNLLLKFSRHLFSDPIQQAQFVEALIHPKSFAPCILWCQPRPAELPFQPEPPLPWQPDFVDRLAIATKPGKHPLHDAGHYYCLDFSSVFAAAVLLAIASPVEVIFDMCASPGGKSIFAWRALHPQVLFANEVIGKRMAALVANLKRCRVSRAIALSLDSKVLSETLAKTADVVLVDAPCTGQSLLAKGDKAPGCFHPVTINKNANRQKRIVANSAQLVAPQGYLAYMTCAYSPEENEQVCTWFLSRFPQFQPVEVAFLKDYQSPLTTLPCYRIFPQDGLGAGAFSCLFQNTASGDKQSIPESFWHRPGLVHLG
ncbi:MAG TPA: RsmB/NOP family class I SAM-dependent RNA methyltransferase [Synechococcales cyanobacterium M55_K2018_004]|nr:RsmB/NOP family class I SAM-dependent RNA methyltransferase [Synechococcales cyanobacterium M55_K2018_004]